MKLITIIKNFVEKHGEKVVILLTVLFFTYTTWFTLAHRYVGLQFVYLAQSFLAGKLHFIRDTGFFDEPAIYQGFEYLPLGPFPAILLTPFVAVAELFSEIFVQSYLSWLFSIIVFFVVYAIARRIKYTKTDSLFWAFAFTFTSSFFGIALNPYANYYAHCVVVLLLLLALLEFTGLRRYWVIGLLLSFALMSRLTAGIGIIFFLLTIITSQQIPAKKMNKALQLLTPFFIAIIAIALYNYLRFDNVFETGYAYQNLIHEIQLAARATGTFALHHVPQNLYYMFLSPPHLYNTSSTMVTFPYIFTNKFGMSLFFVSPYLLYLFFLKIKGRIPWLLLISSIVIAIPILLAWSTGFEQFGNRFSLDFFPFIFLLLLMLYKRKRGAMGWKMKIVIIAFGCLNFYLLLVSNFVAVQYS